MSIRRFSGPIALHALAVVAVLLTCLAAPRASAQILWSSSGGSAWLTGTNWTGSSVPTGTQVAQFGANPSGASGVGINFANPTNAGTQTNGQRIQEVGAVEITSARTNNALLIGNSSGTAGAVGQFRLNGVTVNGVANTIIRNNSSQTLTIQNTQASGNQTMSVILGNATDNVVNIDGAGGVVISSAITGAGRKLSLNGNATGTLILSGANTYSGGTAINVGTLLVNGNSGGATGAVTVSSGGTLGGSGTLGGAVTAESGGVVTAGNGGIGTLTVNNNLTVNGGTIRAELGSSTGDQLNLSGGNYTLDLKNGTTVAVVAAGFDQSTLTYKLADLNGTSADLLKLNGNSVSPDTDLAVFTSTGGNAGDNSNSNLTLSLSGFNLTSGDKLTLRRDAGGDLSLVFTPVPEPALLLAVCGLAVGGGVAWKRWRGRKAAAAAATAV